MTIKSFEVEVLTLVRYQVSARSEAVARGMAAIALDELAKHVKKDGDASLEQAGPMKVSLATRRLAASKNKQD